MDGTDRARARRAWRRRIADHLYLAIVVVPVTAVAVLSGIVDQAASAAPSPPVQGPLPLSAGSDLSVTSSSGAATPSASVAAAGSGSTEEIAPYSKEPSEARPFAICPPPTRRRATCLAVGAAVPRMAVAAGLPRPEYQGTGEGGGFSPADLRSAYDLPSEGGSGETVAITIAYGDKHAEADLKEYRKEYGLPPCTKEGCLTIVNQRGETGKEPVEDAEWAEEASLDLDMVSAACPKCHILLVQADTNEITDLGAAVEQAAQPKYGAVAISDSWAAEEGSGESYFNHYFEHPGIPVLFASGDDGYGASYPAAIPTVVSVGGTHLEKTGSGRGWSESAWSLTGGGCSAYEAKPSWQDDEGCAKRTENDVSAVADTSTPVSVYDKGWLNFGGTSVATPLTAGIEALSAAAVRKEGPRAFARLGQAGALFDPTSGEDGSCPNYLCRAGVGYDGPTGWGTPDGPLSPAVAVTEGAGVASPSTATLHGSVDPKGHATGYHFEYGETTAYGTVVPIPDKSAGAGTEYVEVSQLVEGLKGHRTYHYRITATNSEGTFHGVDHTFGTTLPTAASEPPSGVGAYRVTLNGTVGPEGSTSRYYFEYGPSTSYGTAQPLGGAELTASGEPSEVSTTISGLSPGTTYHYRIVAQNGAGTVHGEDGTFTTDAAQWEARQIPQPAESGNGEEAYGVSCIHPSACIAVGGNWSLKLHTQVTLAESWNGTAWTPMTTPNPAGLEEGWMGNRYAVLNGGVSCPTESSCVAVGEYRDTSATIKPLAESRNGSEWSITPVSLPTGATRGSLDGISCISATSCEAVGSYRDAGGTARLLGERWNGTEWSVQSVPTPEGLSGEQWLLDVSCVSGTMCVAVGEFITAEGLSQLAERWNGSEWSIMAGPPSGYSGRPGLTGVACTSETSCTAVGSQDKLTGGFKPLAEAWNGSEWQVQSTPAELGPDESMDFSSVSCPSSSSCLAAGIRTAPFAGGFQYHSFAERWDGSSWSLAEPAELSVPAGYWQESLLESVSCAQIAACTAVGSTVSAPEGSLGAWLAFADQTIGLPVTSTRAASTVGRNEATLEGTVDPAGAESTYYFEYGPSRSYGSKTESTGVGSGTANVEVGRAVAGLEAGTTYHFRIVATNSHGTVHGADRTFATDSWEVRPSVDPEGASEGALEWTSCASATTCEAVGYDKSTSGTIVPLAERWNGSEWSIQATPIPAGAKSTVLEWISCVPGGACEATGHYENGSGVVVTLAERWNGSEWSLQSTPNPEGASLSDLRQVSCVSATLCTAVGRYTKASGVNFPLAERWNGTRWEVQSTPSPEGSQNTFLYGASCSSATACEATGYYVRGSGGAAPLAERWNGVEWTLQSAPAPEGASNSYLIGVSCSSASACTAVAYYYNASGTVVSLAERWNGTSWEVQPTPNPEGAKATLLVGVSCASASACTATGEYTNGSGVQTPLAEIWDGTKWQVQSVPNPSGSEAADLAGGVSCTSSGACTAVGQYTNASSTQVTLAERWNGTKWEVQPTSNRESVEHDYFSGEPSCVSTTACEAVGASVSGGGSTYRPLAERWNGSEWVMQWTPIPSGGKEVILNSASCSAAGACTAVGNFKNPSGVTQTLAERLNGAEWTIQSTPNPEGATDSRLTSVSCSSSTACAATGYDKNGSGVWVALAEAWNGSAWSVQSMPNPSGAKETKPEGVSCASASSCESTGAYVNSSGVRVTVAESWNGTKWEVQPTPNPEEAKESGLYGVSCASASSCESAGTYESGAGTRLVLVEHWNGATWEVQNAPHPEGAKESSLFGVSCPSSGACEATGWYQNSSGNNVPLTEHWNGTAWTIRTAPLPGGAKEGFLGGVSCTAPSTCMATGWDPSASSGDVTLAESIGGTAPVVGTRSATSMGETETTLNGTVNPNGAATGYLFEYGPTSSYGSSTASASAGSGTGVQEVSKAISGLAGGHTYHFRIVATNPTGTTRGEDQVFTTSTAPPKNTAPPSAGLATPLQAVPEQATAGTWTGEPVYAYQWERCNASGGECAPISGATSSAYTPTGTDIEHTLVVKVTAENAGGSTSTVSAVTGQVKPTGQVTEYSLPSGSRPWGITTGPDGDVWFADSATNKIGKVTTSGSVTEYASSSSRPTNIAAGADGDLWFTSSESDTVSKITTSGTVTKYSVPSSSYPLGIGAGPDGNVWFTDYQTSKIGKVTPSGTITEYALSAGSWPQDITAGPDGNMWFAPTGNHAIGKVTPSGSITEYALPSGSEPVAITKGPDGDLWFCEALHSKIGKITTSGSITEYSLGAEHLCFGVAAGPDGDLWFTEVSANKIGRITPSGSITEYPLPVHSEPHKITVGADDCLWFTEYRSDKIGRIVP